MNTAFTRYEACKRLAQMHGPDFINAGTIGSILTFIPGVMVGFVGFLVFGTTSFFRQIYAESFRNCCGRRSKNSPKYTDEELADRRAWRTMGSDRDRQPTYHCRVVSAGFKEVELTGMERGDVKRGGKVRTFEPRKSPDKVEQPWKFLGVYDREEQPHGRSG